MTDSPENPGDGDGDLPEAARVFGANLKAARTQLGVSLEVIAKRAGIGKTTWWEIEGGLRNLTFKTAEQVSLAVGSTMMHLLLQQHNPLQDEPSQQAAAPLPSGVSPLRKGTLAIELSRGDAFEAASAAAEVLKKSIQLVDPVTRVVAGVASYRGQGG